MNTDRLAEDQRSSGTVRFDYQPHRRTTRTRRRSISRAWPNTIAIVSAPMKRYVLGAFKAGADDDEIAETTGLDLEQVAAIRDHFRDQFGAVI